MLTSGSSKGSVPYLGLWTPFWEVRRKCAEFPVLEVYSPILPPEMFAVFAADFI
jgi:hypothetical protein